MPVTGFNPSLPAGGRGSQSGFTVDIKGLKQMTDRMHRQLLRMEQNHLRRALEAFAEPIRADAQRRARAMIAPYIEIGMSIRVRGTRGSVLIGPVVFGKQKTKGRNAISGPGKDAFWLFFWEYGYHIRHTKKGPALKWIAARPTMRPAYDARKDEGLEAMGKILFDAFGTEGAETAIAA